MMRRVTLLAVLCSWLAGTAQAPVPPQVVSSSPPQWVEAATGMTFVRLPAATFTMGWTDFPPDMPVSIRRRLLQNVAFKYLRPAHRVTLSHSFFMGRTEVTQGQWRSVMGYNPSTFRGDDLPVHDVSWQEAKAFLARLNARAGEMEFRLPTEAEWEYACRAGDQEFMPAVSYLESTEWLRRNSPVGVQAVGQKPGNAFGLHDMQGNVREWCEDWALEDPCDAAPVVDPRGPVTGRFRIYRGCGYQGSLWDASFATRSWAIADQRQADLGFRVVATPRQ
jgi:formylglycine-generating enzyme required for sulfatase activity